MKRTTLTTAIGLALLLLIAMQSAALAGQAQLNVYVRNTSGNAIVGAPVTWLGATQYTDIMGKVTRYVWGCDYCLWGPETMDVTVYRKTYTLDTSHVVMGDLTHGPRSYGFLITHIPNPKPCPDCPLPDNPFSVTTEPEVGPRTSWSMLKAGY